MRSQAPKSTQPHVPCRQPHLRHDVSRLRWSLSLSVLHAADKSAAVVVGDVLARVSRLLLASPAYHRGAAHHSRAWRALWYWRHFLWNRDSPPRFRPNLLHRRQTLQRAWHAAPAARGRTPRFDARRARRRLGDRRHPDWRRRHRHLWLGASAGPGGLVPTLGPRGFVHRDDILGRRHRL